MSTANPTLDAWKSQLAAVSHLMHRRYADCVATSI